MGPITKPTTSACGSDCASVCATSCADGPAPNTRMRERISDCAFECATTTRWPNTHTTTPIAARRITSRPGTLAGSSPKISHASGSAIRMATVARASDCSSERLCAYS